MNAKEEYIKHIGARIVKCAIISREDWDNKSPKWKLPIGYTEQQLQQFLQNININYDSGYGGQELYGTIWYTDGTWSSRGEYDGSEWWEYNKCSAIPKELQ